QVKSALRRGRDSRSASPCRIFWSAFDAEPFQLDHTRAYMSSTIWFRLSRIVVLVAAPTFSGCLPLPEHRRVSPDLVGTLSRDGVPMAHAELRLKTQAVE